MKTAVKIENLSFSYLNRQEPTLKEINLEISAGQFVLLTGATGCGKSTFLKVLNGLIPHQSSGRMTGKVQIMGLDTKEQSISTLAQKVGLVFQNPDDQLFSTLVEDEVVFGPENLGLAPDKIEKRLQEALQAVGMERFRFTQTNNLSGGQKQRIAVASLKTMQPQILALDEPVSQLDPLGAEEVLNVLKNLKEKLGMTIILVEHRIHEVAHLVDRVLIMEKGTLVLDEPANIAFSKPESFYHYGLRLPETVQISHSLGISPPCLSVKELAVSLADQTIKKSIPHERKRIPYVEPIVKIENLSFAYEKEEGLILQDISLQIKRGEWVALMGNNGSGKSTLLKHLMALLKPNSGLVEILGKNSKKLDSFKLAGKVGMVFQNPDLMLFCDTVEKEIEFALQNLGFANRFIRKKKEEVLRAMGIENLKNDFPLALSRGQRLRVALAAVLALDPQLLILDEPTTGQDKTHMQAMLKQLQSFTQEGGTLLFCTHDGETALRYADRLIILHQGQVLADGCPRDIFAQDDILQKANLKAPPSLLLTKELGWPAAYSVQEVLELVQANNT